MMWSYFHSFLTRFFVVCVLVFLLVLFVSDCQQFVFLVSSFSYGMHRARLQKMMLISFALFLSVSQCDNEITSINHTAYSFDTPRNKLKDYVFVKDFTCIKHFFFHTNFSLPSLMRTFLLFCQPIPFDFIVRPLCFRYTVFICCFSICKNRFVKQKYVVFSFIVDKIQKRYICIF